MVYVIDVGAQNLEPLPIFHENYRYTTKFSVALHPIPRRCTARRGELREA
jgi:hypothetical protein